MARVVREALQAEVNVPAGDMVQFVAAYGAGLLAHRRLRALGPAAGAGARATVP
jgi:hypothetical protein